MRQPWIADPVRDLNDRPDRLAERCFAPDVDLQAELRAARFRCGAWRRAGPCVNSMSSGSSGLELVLRTCWPMLDSRIGLTRPSVRRPTRSSSPVARPFQPGTDRRLPTQWSWRGEDVVLEISDVLESIGWNRGVGGACGRVRPCGAWRIPGVYVPSFYRPATCPIAASTAWMDRRRAPATVTARIAVDFETHRPWPSPARSEHRHRLDAPRSRSCAVVLAAVASARRHAVEAAPGAAPRRSWSTPRRRSCAQPGTRRSV